MAREGIQVKPARRAALRRALLAWYRVHHRKLPWRSARPDAYHVLVSEAMLQQTQVATVIAYYERFITAFPTVHDLAAADEQDVLRLWQGLGYYRRARHLHTAARAIVGQHGGTVPDDVESLLSLPGIGRYTAGAVASIAFGRRAPILDGNVARVLSRWFAIEGVIDDPAVRDELWRLAEELVPEESPGDFNQAMMELGATVCTPRSPLCLTCPVASMCRANELGIVDRLPTKRVKRKPTRVEYHAVAVERGGKFLFVQRPAKGLWAGMWQFPMAESLPPTGAVTGKVLQTWLKETHGITCASPRRVDELEHQTTHRTVGVTLWRASGKNTAKGGVWQSIDGAGELPVSRLQRRCAELVRGQ
ncbi:MAG: A/G-specific adenine glycosylase [Planctomycetes bacterium]|nr:A/G-specific adenine glycosylase [Planctomycetota bacterium]